MKAVPLALIRTADASLELALGFFFDRHDRVVAVSCMRLLASRSYDCLLGVATANVVVLLVLPPVTFVVLSDARGVVLLGFNASLVKTSCGQRQVDIRENTVKTIRCQSNV